MLDFIHIWYLGWPWSEHAHIIPILRMVDFCESYSPFHVCMTIRPSAHLVYASSHLSFVTFYSYLVSWLAMIYIIFHYSKRLLANCPGRIHISWFQHSLHSFMPLHYVKSHYNLILYYTSTYVERVGVSPHDNACSFILYVIPGLKIIFIILKVFCKWRRGRPINWTLHGIHACHRNFSKMNKPNKCSIN